MNILIDFLLLGGIGAAFILGYRFLRARRPQNSPYRIAVGLALAAAFLLFWLNGAVGIIGSEDNDANAMYAGVLAIGFFGSLMARFRPVGMARAMFATALAQVVVAAIALGADMGTSGPIWPRDVLGLTAFFAALWGTSAALFRDAAALERSLADAPSES